MSTSTETIEELATREYKYGFVTDVEAEEIPKGLNEDVDPADLRQEEGARVAARVAAEGVPHLAEDERADVAQREVSRPIDYQDIIYYSAPKQKPSLKSLDEVDPEIRKTFDKLGIPDRRAEAVLGRRGRRGVRQRVGRHDVQEAARGSRHHFLLVLRSRAAPSGPGEEVSRIGRAAHGQLLRGAEFGRVLRRLVRVHPEGRALPDGAVDLLPHQRQRIRTVRAHADRRRRRRVCELPRGLHRADARREPAARRGRRARRAGQRDDQVLDDSELVSRRQGRQGRHLQLRDQARPLHRRQFEDHLDAGGDRLGHHLEVSELHSAGRQLGRRVLLGRDDQQHAAGRHRHEDDPPRARTPAARSSRRASRPAGGRTPIAAR